MWGEEGCAARACASEMNLHTPASSGYRHTAPTGHLSSGENGNICIQCRIAEKIQRATFCLSPSASLSSLTLKKKCCYWINSRQLRPGINIIYRHKVWRLVSQDKNLFCGAHWVHEVRHATKLPLLACSDFKASTQSVVSNNLRAKIRAEQGLSDFINTDRFIFLSLMPQ